MSGSAGQLAAQRALSMNFTGSSNQVESTHLEAGGFLSSYQTPKTIKTSECLFSPIVFDTDPGKKAQNLKINDTICIYVAVNTDLVNGWTIRSS